MKIVAQTNDGFLLSASQQELISLLTSFGVKDAKPQIGQEVPAADFARNITHLKNFGNSYDFSTLKEKLKHLNDAVNSVESQLEVVSKV